jgi:phospholipid/cholesterol/gamma-HCH transport system ATP-binding protein
MALIEFHDVHKAFGPKVVCAGINLSIERGEAFTILGGSGSGKTVLMKHMIGLLKPNSGKVIVDGEDIVPMGEQALEVVRRKFGMVFQFAALFDSMTVFGRTSAFRCVSTARRSKKTRFAASFKRS